MFEGYLLAQAVDPRAQTRLFVAGGLAAILCTGALAGAFTMSKLSIDAMTPPHVDDPLMLPNVFAPPPPLAPPPRPSMHEPSPTPRGGATPSHSSAAAPLETDAEPSPETPRWIAGGPPGDGRATPEFGFGPRCAVPPCIANETQVDPRIGDRGQPPSRPPVARAPLSTLRAHAIYSPDPDRNDLLRARSGSSSGRGTSTVMFCVDEGGRIVDVGTSRRFAGQPDVDALCRATVQRWRFRPMLVGGRPTKTCSEVTFDIVFE